MEKINYIFIDPNDSHSKQISKFLDGMKVGYYNIITDKLSQDFMKK